MTSRYLTLLKTIELERRVAELEPMRLVTPDDD